MGQIELTETSDEAEAGTDVVPVDGGSQSSATALLDQSTVRPVFRGVAKSGALLMEPVADPTGSGGFVTNIGRHVGFQYLVQLCLTSVPLIATDLLLMGVMIAISRQLFHFFGGAPWLDLSASFLPIATGFLLIGAEMGLYPGIRSGPVDEFRRLSMAITSIFGVWIVGVAILTGEQWMQRYLYLMLACVMCLIAMPIGRGVVRRILAKTSWWGFPTLVCGHNANVVNVQEWLANNRRLGLRPVGVIADRGDFEIDGDEPWYAGAWSAATEIAKKKGVYWSVVVPSEGDAPALFAAITQYLNTLPHIHILSELTGLPDDWARHQQFDGLTGIHLQQNLMLPLPRMIKRTMDIVAAIIGGILLMPLLFYIAVAVKMSSRGPILYGHDRIGKDGRHFKAWKFRSMFQNSHDVLEQYLDQHPMLKEEWDRDHKLKYDPRITRIGRFMRLTSIDELPQLWNVIRGEMSLVGPRPIVTAEIAKYGPFYGLYTMVTPGITGLWQVSGRNNTTYDERVELDSYYVRNWSPWLDMYLLIRTIRIVLFADGAY
ncbi:MAG TPA: undecaprenyl-phosphate galactose phosphotransferase WbaP [Lacipirellulaceae bacterium]|jgi:Undecaprenyl-phosphate galactose phosphotransferase WbaP